MRIPEPYRGGFMILALAMLLLGVSSSVVAVPPGFNVQGRITDINGETPGDANYNIRFAIYDAPTGGALLWSSLHNQNSPHGPVTLRGGGFQTTLADDPASEGRFKLLKDVFASDNLYLEIQVTGGGELTTPEPPMVPRQRLVAVPFAAKAGQVRRKIFQRGVIVIWSGSGVPAGWCLCDGNPCAAPDGTMVAPPDLRDKFLLGAASPEEIGTAGGTDNPVIDPPAAWSGAITGWSFHSHPGLTKDATKVRWQRFDIPTFQMGQFVLYPKYYKLAYIMKL